MEYSWEELQEAARQIGSTVHKLEKAVKSLEEKEEPRRYRSQITLGKRRIAAFSLALDLIEREMSRIASDT